jgi:hypothetical protein
MDRTREVPTPSKWNLPNIRLGTVFGPNSRNLKDRSSYAVKYSRPWRYILRCSELRLRVIWYPSSNGSEEHTASIFRVIHFLMSRQEVPQWFWCLPSASALKIEAVDSHESWFQRTTLQDFKTARTTLFGTQELPPWRWESMFLWKLVPICHPHGFITGK